MALVDDFLMNPSKIEVILEWQRLKTVKKVKGFLGLVRYYRQFVESFAKLARSTIELTHKDIPFRCSNAYE